MSSTKMKKVLEKLSKKERKTIERCLKDRVKDFENDYYIPDEKIVALSFLEAGGIRHSNRLLAAIMYFISKERIKNKHDFTISIACHTDIVTAGEKIKILFKLYPDGRIKAGSGFLYYLFVNSLANKRFALMLKFSDGDFTEDKPKNINEGKIFTFDKCVICLEEEPKIHFVDCGHICLCEECDEYNVSVVCPVCKTKNNIKRKI